MLILVWIAVLVLSWWFILHFIKRDNYDSQKKEPKWISFVNDLKIRASNFKSKEQLEAYLLEVNEQLKLYETDYSFLVEFNSAVRDIKKNLG